MIITEEPVWYPIYADTNEFEKSTSLTDLDELKEYDEYGRKKRKGSNLKNLEISEISLCQSGKVGVKYLIQKGDEKEMVNETLINDLEKREPEKEVKKYDEIEWSGAQRAIFGYCEDDLAFISDEDIEIEKSSPDDKFPTLTRQFNLNQRRLEKAYEEYAVGERAI